MRKIVINKCFGGFGLSPLAIQKYAELKGSKAYFYKSNYSLKTLTPEPYPTGEDSYTVFFGVPDADWDSYDTHEDKRFDVYSVHRADPDLVSVVEELGADANGHHAELQIVEIPEDVSWIIQDYDGQEWVAEAHRTWY